MYQSLYTVQAQTPEFQQYQRQVVKNARCLAAGLMKLGYSIVTGGTGGVRSTFCTLLLYYKLLRYYTILLYYKLQRNCNILSPMRFH